MEILFLGTSGAWGLPEHQCPCATCRHLREIGQYRTRTSLWLSGPARILVDPGPDCRAQIMREDLPQPQAVLISHEHADHFGGLDELLCYRRNQPRDQWTDIPTYATEKAWQQIEVRFGYLLGNLLEKRLAVPGQKLEGEPFGPDFSCVPVKTDHGPFPLGSVGYIFEERSNGQVKRAGYTSDMVRSIDPDGFSGLDLLVCQCHFMHEPKLNRANHLSLQQALEYVKRWQPGRVLFTHLSCQDYIPGDDQANRILKKYEPGDPLKDSSGRPYGIPKDQDEWQAALEKIFQDQGLKMPVRMAMDGMSTSL